MNKKIIFSLLILIALCVCGTVVIIAGFFIISPIAPVITSTPTEEERIPPMPDSAGQPVTPMKTPDVPSHTLADANNIPIDLSIQMDGIQEQVISIRGLNAKGPVVRDLLSSSELQQKVKTDFFKDYSAEDARDDSLFLTTLGMIPEGFDLLDLYVRLYSEQIAGYYDSDTKEMYVVGDSDFGGIERMTYAHEYTHTLQDQNYDLKNGLKLDDEYCRTNNEYCSAVTALLEGDATFTEQAWMQKSASEQDRKEMEAFYVTYSSPVFDSSPDYIQSDLLFPYLKGLEFVYSLNDRGGYALVDQAFQNPPVTTEQILHPDKYPSEKALPVELPDLSSVLPSGWVEIKNMELGEWYTYLILSKGQDASYQLLDSIARKAAAGWGGDRYALYRESQTGKAIFLLRTRWDTQNDADEFWLAIKQYGEERWGIPAQSEGKKLNWTDVKEGQVLIRQIGQETIWLITPNSDTQTAILATLPQPN
ncbi:hypothetical protein hrd7_11610 [Leptolinea sp. HRD-7]|nr:hypothetical protein hrd7_11610 [Leptolinea sp. HRD-7]